MDGRNRERVAELSSATSGTKKSSSSPLRPLKNHVTEQLLVTRIGVLAIETRDDVGRVLPRGESRLDRWTELLASFPAFIPLGSSLLQWTQRTRR